MARPRGVWADKAWRDAIRKAVSDRHDDGGKKLDALAQKLVSEGLDGDVAALKEIGDRLDGKVPQALEHTGKDGSPLVVSWQPPSE